MSNYDSNKYKFDQLKRRWTKANKFRIELYNNFIELPVSIVELNASIISIQMPDTSNEMIQEWQNQNWVYANGRLSVPQLSITFRDSFTSSGTSNTLYKFFIEYINTQRSFYFDEVKFFIVADMLNPSGEAESGESYLKTEGMLSSVSGVSFNQQTDQIIEFTCNWNLKDTYLFEQT